MKDWFNNLEDKYKILLHIVLCSLSLIIPNAIGDNANAFIYMIWLAILAVEAIFIYWHIQYKKSNTNQETPTSNITETKSVSNIPPAQPVKKIEIDGDFPKIHRDYLRLYQYKENICLAQNLDKLELNDSDLDLVPEPDNQYDENAVALYKGEYKLGYFYKGQTQEMILSYLGHKDFEITTAVCLLDPENNRLAVKIAFYRKLDSLRLDTLTTSLTKITKKTDVLGSSRHENVSWRSVGDLVELTKNDDDGYTVCDELGNELGELPVSIIEKLEDFKIMYAKIANIEETESGNYKVKISIFYR